jgi:hypothetical protein
VIVSSFLSGKVVIRLSMRGLEEPWFRENGSCKMRLLSLRHLRPHPPRVYLLLPMALKVPKFQLLDLQALASLD